MKTIATTLLTLLMVWSGNAQSVENEEALVKITEGIAQNLSEGNFDEIIETFDANMKSGLTATQLKLGWDGLVAQAGAYQETGTVTTKVSGEHRIIYQVLKFEKVPCKLKVVFGKTEEVAGLFLIPVNAE